jgi:hypothetical protein
MKAKEKLKRCFEYIEESTQNIIKLNAIDLPLYDRVVLQQKQASLTGEFLRDIVQTPQLPTGGLIKTNSGQLVILEGDETILNTEPSKGGSSITVKGNCGDDDWLVKAMGSVDWGAENE